MSRSLISPEATVRMTVSSPSTVPSCWKYPTPVVKRLTAVTGWREAEYPSLGGGRPRAVLRHPGRGHRNQSNRNQHQDNTKSSTLYSHWTPCHLATPILYITSMSTAKQSDWTPDAIGDLTGKTALVTGANSGLGYHTAKHLGAAGARVVVTARDETKGASTIASLLLDDPGGKFELIVLDLGDLDSVRRAAAQFASNHSQVHIIVNSAGIMAPPRGETAQGFELQLGVNHFGHFALNALLKDIIVGTPGSRVVNVTSTAAYVGRMRWDDLQWRRSYSRYPAYCQSKLANVLFTMELNRRLHGNGHDGLAAVAHPGLSATNLQRTAVKVNDSVIERFVYGIIIPVFSQSADQGSWPQLRAATDPSLTGGEFFAPHFAGTRGYPVPVRLPKRANMEDSVRLWEVSEELTGIKFDI